jgi:hypothetical protein
MKCGRLVIMAALILALGCAGGPPATTTPSRTTGSSDFAKLCRAVGAEGDTISREQFVAKAQDKETAARLFDACDANRDRLLSEAEAQQGRMDELKREVIRLTTPGGR